MAYSIKEVFSLKVGDTSGAGHARHNTEYYRWTGNLEELECESGLAAFQQVFSLGRNILGCQGDLLNGTQRMDRELYIQIEEYASQFDAALVQELNAYTTLDDDSADMSADGYLYACLAIATIGYGAALPIEDVSMPSLNLGGYELFN